MIHVCLGSVSAKAKFGGGADFEADVACPFSCLAISVER